MVESVAATAPVGRLSGLGQLYVTTVGAVAFLSVYTGGQGWYVALVVLCLPLSLIGLWVAFYAGLAAGLAAGTDPSEFSWAVTLVWVGVWTTTAWINAQFARKVLRHGWRTVAARPFVDRGDEWDDSYTDPFGDRDR